MACPFPDCQSPGAQIEVRYGAREIACPCCGKFKMADKLFDSAAAIFAGQQDSLNDLRKFIHARNGEGKTPMLTGENWPLLAAEQGHAGSA